MYAIRSYYEFGTHEAHLVADDLGNAIGERGGFQFGDGLRQNADILSTFIEQQSVVSCILSTVVDYDEEIKDFLSKNYKLLELTAKTPLPIV